MVRHCFYLHLSVQVYCVSLANLALLRVARATTAGWAFGNYKGQLWETALGGEVSSGEFRLRDCMSNHTNYPPTYWCRTAHTATPTTLNATKILGYIWHPATSTSTL